ncbi:MAG: Cap15 family cyclic dinucleotide receptor domain-containing protein [Candidatus Scalindua sp.]
MLSRLHISSFIGLIIVIWLVALWAQGVPVLSIEFIKPFGIVVGAISFVVVMFSKYAWSWKIFKGWYVNRPDLRGAWKVELKSNWIDPETNESIPPIIGYAMIRQSLTSLSLRLMTKESRSKLIAHSIEKEEDALFRVAAIYRNEPKIELQGGSSEIHHGSFLLEIHGDPVLLMEGHYWTDRGTKGSMNLTNHRKELYDTYEQAASSYGE